MWDHAYKSGGLYNPGRRRGTSHTSGTVSRSTPTLSAAERRRQKAAASLEGTRGKAPLVPADPVLRMNSPPAQSRKRPSVQQHPLQSHNKRQNLAPLHDQAPPIISRPPTPPQERNTSSTPSIRTSCARKRKHINYNERELDLSITGQFVQDDSGDDHEYDDLAERRRGGHLPTASEADDDNDILQTWHNDSIEAINFEHLISRKKPKLNPQKKKKVNYNNCAAFFENRHHNYNK